MQIASNSAFGEGRSFDVNLAAAIQLKNLVDFHWRHGDYEKDIEELDEHDIDPDHETAITISVEDKDFVKNNIVQAMANSPSLGVLAQFEEVVNVVARYELPNNWSNVMTEVSELINKDDERSIYAGLVALKEIVKRFEYEFKEKREPLNEIADNLFPILEKILENIISLDSDDSAKVKHVIIKIFFFANQVRLCKRYIKDFDSFFNAIYETFTSKIPEELTQPTDDADVVAKYLKTDHWKMKIECMKLINKLYNQLYDPVQAEDPIKKLSKYFDKNYSSKILDLALNIIETSIDNYVAHEIVSNCIRIICKSTKGERELPKQIKDNYDNILFKLCLPLLRLSPLEIEEFNDNPVSYVRNQFDVADTLNSMKNSAIDMMNFLVTYVPEDAPKNTKPEYAPKFLEFLYKNLSDFEKAETKDFRDKESIMLALGQIGHHIKNYDDMKEGVETIIKEHIYPELMSENSILRARALWTYGELHTFIQDPDHAIGAVECVYKSLLDDCLPVKVFAGTSLHKLSKIKEAKAILEPGVDKIIAAYLQVMQEIDQDELVNALEEIVNIFDDKIEPFAFELVQQLVIQFKKASKNDGNDKGESLLTANG